MGTFELRPYQRSSVDATIADLNAGIKRTANILPTGAGKTEVMAKTIEAYLSTRKDESALVLSHLSLLTQQSFDRFKKRIPALSVGIMQGDNIPTVLNDIVISTMQTARNERHVAFLKDLLCKRPTLIVVDETHMLPTASYEQIQSYFPEAQLIGYTATPFREKKLMTNYFDKISFTISLQELIDQGYLVEPIVNEITIPDNGSEHAPLLSTLALYMTREAGKKAIIYTKTIQEAKMMTMLLEEHGIHSSAVTSETTGPTREEIFDRFSHGTTNVLTTVDVLTAGFDSPQVEAIFMPYGTKSPTQYLQRIGRGLRPYEGKESCRIFMLGDAPSVQNKAFERINRIALNAGKSRADFDTYKEDLELTFWDKSTETYHWTKEVVDLVDHMNRVGMTNFAAMLNAKQFPRHFMASIKELIARVPKKKHTLPHGNKAATDSQLGMLFDQGFTGEQLRSLNLSKNEASMMISAVLNRSNDPSAKTKQFIVPEGMHKGKHVSQLPHKYRSYVKQKMPDSPVAQLLSQWETERKKA